MLRTGKGSGRNPGSLVAQIRGYEMARPPARFFFSTGRVARLCYGVGLLAIIAAIGHVSYSFFLEVPYFNLAHLKIEGVSDSIAQELKGVIEKSVAKSPSLLKLDLSTLNRVLASHPRVRNVRFEKMYPDTLLIRAAEREPTVIVNTDGFFLVDREGYVMEKLNADNLHTFDLPHVSGLAPDEVAAGQKIYSAQLIRALDLCRALRSKNQELYGRLSEINLGCDPVSQLDSMTITLKGGMQVRFGDRNPVQLLPQFDLFAHMQRKQGVDPFSMEYVDLRFESQIVYMDRQTALSLAKEKLGLPEPPAGSKETAVKDVELRDSAGSSVSADPSEQAVDETAASARSVGTDSSAVGTRTRAQARGDAGNGSAGSAGRTPPATPVVYRQTVQRTMPAAVHAPGTAAAAPAGQSQKTGFFQKLWGRRKTAAPYQGSPAAELYAPRETQ